VTADDLADVAAAALVACRAAEAEAAEALDRARAVRDEAVWSLVQAGWTYRKIAAELDMSAARVGQLVQRARQAGWGVVQPRPLREQDIARQDYRAARHAQELREEAFTGGRATERRAFYGHRSAPAVAEAEQPITWHGWLSHSRQECAT
jgi:cytochrome c551/c552